MIKQFKLLCSTFSNSTNIDVVALVNPEKTIRKNYWTKRMI